MRGRTSAVSALILACAFAAGPAWSAPPPPPGGRIPIHHGGNNRAGYPPLNQPLAVPRPNDKAPMALAVTSLPNPFRASTQFRFVTRIGERGRLRVFAPDGRQVRELVAVGSSGAQALLWDGRDQRGRRVPAGVYLYRVDAGARTASGKVVRLR